MTRAEQKILQDAILLLRSGRPESIAYGERLLLHASGLPTSACRCGYEAGVRMPSAACYRHEFIGASVIQACTTSTSDLRTAAEAIRKVVGR